MRDLFPTPRAWAAACLLAAGSCGALAAQPEDALASLQSAFGRAVRAGEEADRYRELFAPVLQRIERSYASEVDLAAFASAGVNAMAAQAEGTADPREAFTSALNAALRTLDPYSRYLDARGPAGEGGWRDGSFGGLGLEVEAGEGAVRVVAPIPGAPAERAGVQSGDLIVRIDEQPLERMPLADAIARMRGTPGTAVTITIRRRGVAEEFSVSLVRDTIRRQALRWNMEGEVLVLRLASFMGPVASALRQAVGEATAAHAPTAVVLDLRGNPGGYLREAVTVADAFLVQGEIVSLRGRTPGNLRSWKADEAELLPGVPMVVLLDRRSASASELVAAALQDNGRAVVMGQRSFGKGTVQTTYSLGEEVQGRLRLTSAFYFSPSGRSVQATGVAPDVELLGALAEEASGEAGRAPLARVEPGRCAAVVKAADPALSCAVAYLRAGSVEAFVGSVTPLDP